MIGLAEYIWLDGTKPTKQLRSKSKVIDIDDEAEEVTLEHFPDWSFDGSSTAQSEGHFSDLLLKPAFVCLDPLRGDGNYLVLCEVYDNDGTPHASNTRALLRHLLAKGGQDHDPWIGFEQEYAFFKEGRPLGWPTTGSPKPQGPYYCAVGSEKIFGRDIVEEHSQACMDADLLLFGTNAEVMPGQWEFQLGYRGSEEEDIDILTVSDQLWVARWLLCRIAEDYEVTVSFDNKPMKGDWNGAGCHTNFSTKHTRTPKVGLKAIEDATARLREKHKEHIAVYGHGLEERLTGHHETCSIHEFRSGVADRGASVRVPSHVKQQGCGYLEDRRPGSNCDPYEVSSRLIATICNLDYALQPKKEEAKAIA